MALGRKWKETLAIGITRATELTLIIISDYIIYDCWTSREKSCNVYSGNYFKERKLREKMFTERFNDTQRDAKLTSCMRTEATLDSASINNTGFLRNKMHRKICWDHYDHYHVLFVRTNKKTREFNLESLAKHEGDVIFVITPPNFVNFCSLWIDINVHSLYTLRIDFLSWLSQSVHHKNLMRWCTDFSCIC